MAWICRLSAEILHEIFSFLTAKTVLNVTETCKWLKEFLLESDSLWQRLCFEDFIVFLKVKGPFQSFFEIYKALYKALYKYDKVQEQIYGEKCQLTFYCDVFKLPDYLYHWCTLLCQCTMHWPLSRGILTREKFKKMWGLLDADLVELPPNGSGRHMLTLCDHFRSEGFIWADGLDASVLKYGSIRKFHEVALQRCKKSVKRIEAKFTTAARVFRVKKLLSFLHTNNYQKIENCIIREERSLFDEVYFDEKEDDLCLMIQPRSTPSEDPCKIGVDYARGLLHRPGFQQIINFSMFCVDLTTKLEVLPQFTEEDIKQCTQFVYIKLSHKAKEKLISPKEFMKCARKYEERIDRVWKWQCKKGEEQQKKYRGQEVKSHQSYKNFIQTGDEKEFDALKTYFDDTKKRKK